MGGWLTLVTAGMRRDGPRLLTMILCRWRRRALLRRLMALSCLLSWMAFGCRKCLIRFVWIRRRRTLRRLVRMVLKRVG